jgi:hypothetical protein
MTASSSSTPENFSADALHRLWLALRGGEPVELINNFHGVPVTSQAVITMVGREYAGFSAERCQAVCIAREKRALLRGALFPGVVQARALSVDVEFENVILTDFAPAGARLGSRTTLRVAPKEPLPVEISAAGGSFSAALADLSSGGPGVYTFGARVEGAAGLRTGETVTLEVSLPGEDRPVVLRGLVTSLRRSRGSQAHRAGIQVTGDAAAERPLAAYLARREQEIRRELEKTCAVAASASKA